MKRMWAVVTLYRGSEARVIMRPANPDQVYLYNNDPIGLQEPGDVYWAVEVEVGEDGAIHCVGC